MCFYLYHTLVSYKSECGGKGSSKMLSHHAACHRAATHSHTHTHTFIWCMRTLFIFYFFIFFKGKLAFFVASADQSCFCDVFRHLFSSLWPESSSSRRLSAPLEPWGELVEHAPSAPEVMKNKSANKWISNHKGKKNKEPLNYVGGETGSS